MLSIAKQINSIDSETRMNKKPKHILIVGFSKTGLSVALHCTHANIAFSIIDQKSRKTIIQLLQKYPEINPRFILSEQQTKVLPQEIDIVIVSPGIPTNHPILLEAKKQNIPVLSEIEWAFAHCSSRNIIGITGSNGKTTVCSWITQMTHASGRHAITCGNIGIPWTSQLPNITPKTWVIAELSSFMLEKISDRFLIPFSCLLNITPNHLDRHKNQFSQYIQAKTHWLKNQNTSHYCVANADCVETRKVAKNLQCHVLFFSKQTKNLNLPSMNKLSPKQELIATMRDGTIFACETPIVSEKEIQQKQLPLSNVLATIALGTSMGLSSSQIAKSVNKFRMPPHRMENLGHVNQVYFINDSKATTPEAVSLAIQSQQMPTILLMGGKNKSLDFSMLNAILNTSHIKIILFFGQDAVIMAKQIQSKHLSIITKSLEDAFYKAIEQAIPGDIILLSPGGTSLDAYSCFEERGRHFSEMFQKHKKQTLR